MSTRERLMMLNHILVIAILSLLPGLSFGVDAAPVSQQITMSVDADLIAFVKIAIWLGGGFLVIYALIGVAFFGWDVAKARGSINEAQKEVKKLLKEFQVDYAKLKDLKERLEETGAKLQEDAEAPRPSGSVGVGAAVTPAFRASSEGVVGPPPESLTPARSNIDLIREVIASSNYEWTTIGRLMNKTGLSRDDILREARSARDIVISRSSQTDDFLFKFDRIKWVLSNPEWLRDPTGKARKEAHKALDELMARRDKGIL